MRVSILLDGIEKEDVVFYIKYLFAELRRRMGRTLLTALGLGIGVALVISTTALSAGLDNAQQEVLEPLTGVGTDMTVTRPIEISDEGTATGGFGGGLSAEDQEQLEEENGGTRFGFGDLGEPGTSFSNDSLVSTSQLSFSEDEISNVADIDGVSAVSGSLTLTNMHTEGKVPEFNFEEGAESPPPGEDPQGDIVGNIEIEQFVVTGVDTADSTLSQLSPSNISEGRDLANSTDEREAVVSTTYATTNDLVVADKISVGGKKFTIVGLAKAPVGGSTTDAYVELTKLQESSDREGRVNTLAVSAVDTDAVAQVAAAIPDVFDGAEVTTAQDLADRVGGSLVDAENLVSRLSFALTIVGLLAAFLIASFLTLSSVAKRTRELGTLKAIGWSQRKIVRQVTLESLGQGLLGGGVGALIGLGAAAVFNAMNVTMQATVAAAETPGLGAGGPGFGGFGQEAAQTAAETTSVVLSAPIEPSVLIMAVVLALLGGLIAGGIGSFRASRLRPAEALRTIG